MRAIDTNVLVRLIARDEPAQVASAERFVEAGAWVSHLTLVEATWVLDSVYDLRPGAIATAVEMLLNNEQLTVQDAETVRAAVALLRAQPALGFSDCLILEVARKAGHAPLGTFDRALGRVAGAVRI